MAFSRLAVALSTFTLSLAMASCSNNRDNHDPGLDNASGGSARQSSTRNDDEDSGGTVGAGGTAHSGNRGGKNGLGGSGAVAPIGGQTSGTGKATGTTSPGSGGRTGAGGSGGAELPAGTGGSVATGKGGTKSSSGSAAAGADGSGEIRARTINARGLTFDALEIGATGEPVLLLHGFPDTSLEWTALMPVLAASGYHCLAPDQRGYSPGARPTEVDAYKYEELVADAFAFGSELGERFHVVAHDWGANVGWLMVQKDPSRIASFTAISIPHYQVWARSVYDDNEMAGYLSMLNTWMTEGKGEAYWTADQMRRMWTAKPADQREATITHMTAPGAMTAALNWYRASRGHKRVIEEYDVWEVNVPTLLIFGSKDVGTQSLTDTAPLMTGPYRLVRPQGGHFIVDEQPKAVADEVLTQLRAYPLK